jgi:hypothetical protein
VDPERELVRRLVRHETSLPARHGPGREPGP